jgi:hypothetical protein
MRLLPLTPAGVATLEMRKSSAQNFLLGVVLYLQEQAGTYGPRCGAENTTQQNKTKQNKT